MFKNKNMTSRFSLEIDVFISPSHTCAKCLLKTVQFVRTPTLVIFSQETCLFRMLYIEEIDLSEVFSHFSFLSISLDFKFLFDDILYRRSYFPITLFPFQVVPLSYYVCWVYCPYWVCAISYIFPCNIVLDEFIVSLLFQ